MCLQPQTVFIGVFFVTTLPGSCSTTRTNRQHNTQLVENHLDRMRPRSISILQFITLTPFTSVPFLGTILNNSFPSLLNPPLVVITIGQNALLAAIVLTQSVNLCAAISSAV